MASIVVGLVAMSGHAYAENRPVSRWTQLADETMPRKVGMKATTNGQVTNYTVAGEGLDLIFSDEQTLRQKSQSEQIENANWIYNHRDELPGAYILEVARVRFAKDPEEAAALFFFAQIRMRYDALRCKDRSAAQGVLYTSNIAQNVIAYMAQHPVERTNAIKAVHDRDDLFTGKVSPWWICSHGIMAVVSANSSKGVEKSDWLMDSSEWPAKQKLLTDALKTAALNKPKAN